VFDLVGFARGHDLRHTLQGLVTMHLTRLRERGVVSALAHLDGAST
jgi:hypothetical protein